MPSTQYEIVIRGRIGPRLRGAIDGFEVISSGPDESRLVGWVVDQAALQHVMRQLNDLGFHMKELREVESNADRE